jgi:hypothetical protein
MKMKQVSPIDVGESKLKRLIVYSSLAPEVGGACIPGAKKPSAEACQVRL